MSGATQHKDGTKKRWIHGRAVQDGKLRFLSVSSLEKGDSSKPTGCLRRWHYQYIGGIKEAPSDAMAAGERMHAEIAHYLTTGENVLSSQVMSGMHMLPDPGPDLLVEHDIVPTMPDGKSGIAIAPLRASGVPIVGAIDLIHGRGVNKGTEDIEHIYDPKGTIEVIDWKSCRTLDNIKKGPELLRSIQMAGYGKYVFETEPDAQLVRLSHGYFPSRGVPRKTTIRVDRDQIEKSWEHANRVASSISDAAKEPNPDLVEANTDACTSYGRDCPAKSVCSAVKNNALSMFVGNVLAEQVIPAGNLIKNMSEVKTGNSILAGIKARQSTLPEPRANRSIFGQIAATQATPAPAPVADQDAIAAEMAKLEAKERLAKGPELLPPDAPASNPLLASKPQVENSFTQAMAAVTIDASEAISDMVEAVPAPKKRGRKKKEESEVPEIVTVAGDDFKAVPNVTSGAINFYVDSAVEGVEIESFWPIVDALVDVMNEQCGDTDFRRSKHELFDFGKWKGLLATMIRQTPIQPGNYQLLHAQGDIALVVVETMRDIVRKSGGLFVTGAR